MAKGTIVAQRAVVAKSCVGEKKNYIHKYFTQTPIISAGLTERKNKILTKSNATPPPLSNFIVIQLKMQ